MQYINYDAIIKNANYFKSILGKSKLCAVVKCDAYGHGMVRVASCLRDIVDCFAVNDVAEANKISQFGKDILVLMPQDAKQSRVAAEKGYILTLDSFDTLQTLLQIKANVVRVHIKIDSGMSRLGFRLEQISNLLAILQGSKIVVEGIFSHFYDENEIFCQEQLNYFAKCSKIVSRKFGNITKHIANSAATLLNDRYHLDMVRVGLGLYGYGSQHLAVAKTVTAKVIALKHLPKGSVVGYGGGYRAKSDIDIAVINIGYNNGYVRALHSPIVQIGDNFTKVIGNICMSMSMVDVTNLPVNIGDEVVVLGKNVNPATNDTIIYQLLCNLR